MDKYVSSIIQISALALLLITVIILSTLKLDISLMHDLVMGAVGLAGAIAGFSQHTATPGNNSNNNNTVVNDPNGPLVKKD